MKRCARPPLRWYRWPGGSSDEHAYRQQPSRAAALNNPLIVSLHARIITQFGALAGTPMFCCQSFISIYGRYGLICKAAATSVVDSDGWRLSRLIDTVNPAGHVWDGSAYRSQRDRKAANQTHQMASLAVVPAAPAITSSKS